MPPCEFHQGSCFDTHITSLPNVRHCSYCSLILHLPPCFLYVFFVALTPTQALSCSHMHKHRCKSTSTILIYWSQTSTKTELMTDNHIFLVICGKVPGRSGFSCLFQILYPTCLNWLFVFGLHGKECSESYAPYRLSYSSSISFR